MTQKVQANYTNDISIVNVHPIFFLYIYNLRYVTFLPILRTKDMTTKCCQQSIYTISNLAKNGYKILEEKNPK